MQLDLGRLLHGVSVEQFFERYWERRPLYVRRHHPDFYAGLASTHDIDVILETHRFRPNDLRLIKDGKLIRDIKTRLSDESLDMAVVRAEYSRGATILLIDADLHAAGIAAICHRLSQQIGHVVAANIYLTPAQSRGFNPHYDHHDVFVLQLEGVKRWRLFQEYARLPMPPAQPETDVNRIGECLHEVDLSPGDLLYLPRGHVHQAFCLGGHSLHITLGVHVTTWSRLIGEALAAYSEREPAMRAAIPQRLSIEGRHTRADRAKFTRLLRRFANEATLGEASRGIAGYLIDQRRPYPDGHLTQINALDGLTADSHIAHRAHMAPRVDVRNGSIVIHYQGNKVEAPEAFAEAFRYIAAHDAFRVSSIPGPLDTAAKVALVRRLIVDGLLAVQDVR